MLKIVTMHPRLGKMFKIDDIGFLRLWEISGWFGMTGILMCAVEIVRITYEFQS